MAANYMSCKYLTYLKNYNLDTSVRLFVRWQRAAQLQFQLILIVSALSFYFPPFLVHIIPTSHIRPKKQSFKGQSRPIETSKSFPTNANAFFTVRYGAHLDFVTNPPSSAHWAGFTTRYSVRLLLSVKGGIFYICHRI